MGTGSETPLSVSTACRTLANSRPVTMTADYNSKVVEVHLYSVAVSSQLDFDGDMHLVRVPVTREPPHTCPCPGSHLPGCGRL
jgi:hypothetical protein